MTIIKDKTMKNVTFHLKNEDVLDFLEEYNGNKSELVEGLIREAMIAEQKKEFLALRNSIQKIAQKSKLSSSEDTVKFTRKLRQSR